MTSRNNFNSNSSNTPSSRNSNKRSKKSRQKQNKSNGTAPKYNDASASATPAAVVENSNSSEQTINHSTTNSATATTTTTTTATTIKFTNSTKRPIENDNGTHNFNNNAATPTDKPNGHGNTSKSKNSSHPLQRALYTLFFFIAIGRTIPKLLDTVTLSACGKDFVHKKVDMVYWHKMGDPSCPWMERKHHLDDDDGRESAVRVKLERNINMQGEGERVEEKGLLCHMASTAIGHFVYWVPYGKDLIGYQSGSHRGIAPNCAESGMKIDNEAENNDDNDDANKAGILQRVVSRHKRKHDKLQRRRQNQQQPHQLQQRSAEEEIDRKHPIRHILEGASIFFHHKQIKKWARKQHPHQTQQLPQKDKTYKKEIKIDWSKWKYAMSDDFELSSEQTRLVKELARRVLELAKNVGNRTSLEIVRLHRQPGFGEGNDGNKSIKEKEIGKSFLERVERVPWGGVNNKDSTRWYPRKDGRKPDLIAGQVEGGRLLASYLKIMKYPKDLHIKFPFRLCAQGCNAEIALLHTLEWREKYKPFCMSPSSIQRNKVGFIYHRGHSRAGPRQQTLAKERGSNTFSYDVTNAGHTMIWLRPGITDCEQPEMYIRTVVNTVERAVSDSLLRNNGEIGRFNVVMDFKGLSRKSTPSLSYIKKGMLFLQDHYPDRLGVLLIVNLSGIAQMMMKLVLPFVSEEVRKKIHVIPDGEKERREVLEQILEVDQIPDWLGGKDEFRFNVDEYYGRGEIQCVLKDEELVEYRETMPYHA